MGRLADAANYHPDVDLRDDDVTVRLSTHDLEGLSERDIPVAQQIRGAVLRRWQRCALADRAAARWAGIRAFARRSYSQRPRCTSAITPARG
jgi:Pterin 4 alpha carbinolamine dehydratase